MSIRDYTIDASNILLKSIILISVSYTLIPEKIM